MPLQPRLLPGAPIAQGPAESLCKIKTHPSAPPPPTSWYVNEATKASMNCGEFKKTEEASLGLLSVNVTELFVRGPTCPLRLQPAVEFKASRPMDTLVATLAAKPSAFETIT